MSSPTAVQPEVRRTPNKYRVTMDHETECHYLHLVGTQGNRLASEFWTPAGDSPTMVVADAMANTPIVRGIEVIRPIEVRDEGDLFPWTQFREVQFIVGLTDEPVTTVVDGTRFDGSDVGEYPGVQVDFTDEGEMVAIRIRTFPRKKPTGIKRMAAKVREVLGR